MCFFHFRVVLGFVFFFLVLQKKPPNLVVLEGLAASRLYWFWGVDYYIYSQRRTWLVGTLSWKLFLTRWRTPRLSVTFSCLYYLWSFIPFISKWEGKMGITSRNRWRHTKQYYGNIKLKHLLLVFLGNQEATGAKNDRFFFSWITLLFLLSGFPTLLRVSPFLHLFFSFSWNSRFIESKAEAYKGSIVNE